HLAHGAAAAPAGAFLGGRFPHRRHPAEVEAALHRHDHRIAEPERLLIVGPEEIVFPIALEADFDGGGHHASVKTPIPAYFSARRRISFSGRTLRSSPRWRSSASRSASPAASGSWWATPRGLGMISSMILNCSRSAAVSLSASAARSRWLASFQRIAAQPSGEITE